MDVEFGVPRADALPPAYRKAANIRRDLGRAVGLYGLGDRSEIVLRTLAAGKAAYDAVGAKVPRPVSVDWETWNQTLDALKRLFGERPYFERETCGNNVALAG